MDRVRARDPSARRPHGDARRFFHKLVDVVVDMLGGAFPELKKDPENVPASGAERLQSLYSNELCT